MTETASQDTNITHFRTMTLGFIAGPLTWGIYFLAGYLLIEAGCKSELFGLSLLGLSGISTAVLGLTIIALSIVLFAGWWSYRTWRDRRDEVPGTDNGGPFEGGSWLADGYVRFMTFVGMLLNVLFAVVIIFTGLAVFLYSLVRKIMTRNPFSNIVKAKTLWRAGLWAFFC